MQRVLIVIGLVLLVVGIAWPWLSKSGLGRLPGDFLLERDNFKFYFPLTTSILVSVAVAIVLWLFRR